MLDLLALEVHLVFTLHLFETFFMRKRLSSRLKTTLHKGVVAKLPFDQISRNLESFSAYFGKSVYQVMQRRNFHELKADSI